MKVVIKFSLSFTLGFYILLIAQSSWALTPQKYCETLAATSCEVLNLELAACSNNSACSGMLKYCRDRKFQIVPIFHTAAVNATFISLSGTQQISNPNGGGATAWSSTSLCAIIP